MKNWHQFVKFNILKVRIHGTILRAMAELHRVSTSKSVACNIACNIAVVESHPTSATRETRWLKWSSSIRRYYMNELGSSVASSRTILWNAPISCLLAIQPLTQTWRFLLLMRAFSSPSKSINARTPKAFFCHAMPFWIVWCKHHRMRAW